MSEWKKNLSADNLQYSDIVIVNLYSLLRIYKLSVVAVTAELEDKSYKVIIVCENQSGKISRYRYYLTVNSLKAFEDTLLDDYGIKVEHYT